MGIDRDQSNPLIPMSHTKATFAQDRGSDSGHVGEAPALSFSKVTVNNPSPGEKTLHEANKLFRMGDLVAAMQIYLMLHEQRHLRIYADNALFSARKLGMGNFPNVEELKKSLAR